MRMLHTLKIGLDMKWAFFEIWKPDLYIYNINKHTFTRDDQIYQVALRIVPRNPWDPWNRTDSLVFWKFEGNVEIYCDFHYYYYPMDNQTCEFRRGTQSPNYKLIRYKLNDGHLFFDSSYDTGDYEVVAIPFEDNVAPRPEMRGMGLNIQMRRKVMPFILRYYLPCVAIVLASQVSFVIPLSAIPGRVALVVTQFLTLTNIFIHQMV